MGAAPQTAPHFVTRSSDRCGGWRLAFGQEWSGYARPDPLLHPGDRAQSRRAARADRRWHRRRHGFAELLLPQNEPGSSIMPGKVNPTQCEAMVMISIQVLGDDAAIAFSGSQGNFELNAMRPVIINNFLHSARILGDGIEKFVKYSVSGTELNRPKIESYVGESLMLVTALSPVIGYQNAAHIAENALANDQTLKQAALASGHLTEQQFDSIVVPAALVGHGVQGA
ncbi:hypothetical protein JL106_00165 [Nakamurella sp. YIM 132084]|uniref:aspartate ammonia-lyase n=1 Tax=Nakamurella leprariae TaxID=2803911 RepID=A0A938Y431_9ACTN|nr:lyase family protein [Nakamurella leprariae]MBM9465691.1 hypothetical protein [Nakamurella leprariae]